MKALRLHAGPTARRHLEQNGLRPQYIGLVHVSQLANKFVTDAREVVKTGDIVKVRVTEVDVARKRIGLSMKLDAAPARRDGPRDNKFEGAARGERTPNRNASQGHNQGINQGINQGYNQRPEPAGQGSAMASAFAKLQGLKK